jgi:hypothetical protein
MNGLNMVEDCKAKDFVSSKCRKGDQVGLLVCSFDRTIKRGSYTSSLTMHSKSHKRCTLKFLGCYLAQRVHGSKVEAKESTENSKVLNWMS